MGPNTGRKVYEQTFKRLDSNLRRINIDLLDHLNTFFDRKQRLFLWVAKDANMNFIKESFRPVNDLNMPVRHRVERTRINGNVVNQYPSTYSFGSSTLVFPCDANMENAVSPTLTRRNNSSPATNCTSRVERCSTIATPFTLTIAWSKTASKHV